MCTKKVNTSVRSTYDIDLIVFTMGLKSMAAIKDRKKQFRHLVSRVFKDTVKSNE